jgi:hypothetical protein
MNQGLIAVKPKPEESMFLRFLFAAALATLVAGCAAIGATSGRVVIQDENTRVAVSFSSHDRALIGEYYDQHKKRLPPGLAKRRGGLPPGLAKRDRLPPGLQRDPLPRELEAQLSTLPSGYVRVRVGQDIVLIDGRTHVVIDVIYGIAF